MKTRTPTTLLLSVSLVALLAALFFATGPVDAAPAAADGGGWVASLLVRRTGGAAPPTPTPAPTRTPTPTRTPAPGNDPVLIAVGDIGSCISSGDEETARLVTDPTWIVAALGDTVYESGTAQQFRDCYDPNWGAFKDRTRPAVGNHDYLTAGATPYFNYFGPAAGDPNKGYYSYDLGTWHVVVLNSNCGEVGGCHADSPQAAWLRADLAAHPAACTLAYWHHPLFGSTGTYTDARNMRPFWGILYDAGADLVLGGHAHNYERLGPLNPSGAADGVRGLRSFVVGTGGASHQALRTISPHSEARDGDTYGVLKLTLRASGYDWKFLPVAGASFTDSGTGSCH